MCPPSNHRTSQHGPILAPAESPVPVDMALAAAKARRWTAVHSHGGRSKTMTYGVTKEQDSKLEIRAPHFDDIAHGEIRHRHRCNHRHRRGRPSRLKIEQNALMPSEAVVWCASQSRREASPKLMVATVCDELRDNRSGEEWTGWDAPGLSASRMRSPIRLEIYPVWRTPATAGRYTRLVVHSAAGGTARGRG
jgi:hypothetical protein